MTYIHDCIKIRLSHEGYLMNYPYHLVSNEEMCEAFLSQHTDNDSGAFFDKYPRSIAEGAHLLVQYNTLVSSIRYFLQQLINSGTEDYALPNWVYSYMMGSTIGKDSSVRDIQDLYKLLGGPAESEEFNSDLASSCFAVSQSWLRRFNNSESVEVDGISILLRPPTMFGEPHVLKSLRLSQSTPK